MTQQEETGSLFEQGFSCTQSVLVGCSKSSGLDRDMALKLARSFGAGMGLGETCGAVTGAFMVLGLTAGPVVENDRQARMRSYQLNREFVRRFKEIHGTVNCRELIGVDLGTDDGMKEAQEKNIFKTICPAFVKDAERIIKELTA